MPIKDPEKRREANRIRMQKRRAEGKWIDPDKERERKKVWYEEKGGHEKMVAQVRRFREKKKEAEGQSPSASGGLWDCMFV